LAQPVPGFFRRVSYYVDTTFDTLEWRRTRCRQSSPVLFAASLINPAASESGAVLSTTWVPVHLVIWMGSVLTVFGLIGLYLRQAEESRCLGLVAFVLLFFGYVITAAAPAVEATDLPALARAGGEAGSVEALLFDPAGPLGMLTVAVGLSFVVTSIGYMLTGIAILRARVFPRASGVLLICGPLVSVVYLIMPEALFPMSAVYVGIVEAALFWLGLVLLVERGTVAP
jgi:hypothetical protein